MNTNLRPEDFWPDAEKLLNRHYKAKRQRKVAFWTISLLTLAGAILFLTFNENEISTESQKGSNSPVSSIEKNSFGENNSAQKPISENNTPAQITIKENNETAISPKQITSGKKELSKDHSDNSGQTTASKNKNPIVSNSVIVKNNSIKVSRENNSVKNSGLQTTISGTPSNSSAIISNSSIFVNPQNAEMSKISEPSVTTVSSENNKSQSPVYALQARHFKDLKIDRTHRQLISSRGEEISQPKARNSAEYRFEILAGVNQISKSISGFENLAVEQRRNSWETEVIAPQLNLAISRSTDNYSIALGLAYTQYGEKVNYDPGVKSLFLVDNSYWNTYLTNVLITDTNYIFGYVYLTQQTIQRLDSNYIQQTDSVEQIVINQNILKSTGTNIVSFVEMPVTFSYYFGKKKFKYGVSAGVSAGMLVYSKGYYLNNAGNDVYNISDTDLFRKIILNGQVGLELKYCMSPGIHFLLRPKYQMNLNSIVKDDAGFEQKYSAIGISAGVSFMLK